MPKGRFGFRINTHLALPLNYCSSRWHGTGMQPKYPTNHSTDDSVISQVCSDNQLRSSKPDHARNPSRQLSNSLAAPPPLSQLVAHAKQRFRGVLADVSSCVVSCPLFWGGPGLRRFCPALMVTGRRKWRCSWPFAEHLWGRRVYKLAGPADTFQDLAGRL